MSRYEVLMLAVPEITQDETAALESQIQSVTKKANAAILSFERWGKYRLAYPVKKNAYGVYFLARLETTQEPHVALDALRSLLAVDQRTIVMRYVIDVLDTAGSLEYRRPPSLEETPAKEPSSFTRGERGEGRNRGEGRGPRGSFNRGPRGGARAENDRGMRGDSKITTAQDDELDLEHDMNNEGAE